MTPTPNPTDTRLQAEAQKAFAAGDYVNALRLFVEWANGDPQNHKAREHIADSLHRLGRIDQAVAMYKKVAAAYMAAGSIIKAIAIHKTILALDPNDQEIKSQLLSIFGEKVPEELAPVVKETKPTAPVKPAAGKATKPGKITADDLGLADLDDRVLPGSATGAAGAGNMDELNTVFKDILGEDTSLQEFSVQSGAASTVETFARTPLFSDLNADELEALIDDLKLSSYTHGQAVCKEGDASNVMWVIVQGEAEIQTGKRDGTATILLATLTEGDFFGEGGFVTGAARTASVTAKGDLTVLEITKANFDKAAAQRPHMKEVLQAFYHNRTADIAMAKSELFGLLPSFRRAELMQSFLQHEFKSKAMIVKAGEKAAEMFLIKTGTVELLNPQQQILRVLGPGDTFGENSIVTGKPLNFSARAMTDVELLGLRKIEVDGVMQMFPEAEEILKRAT